MAELNFCSGDVAGSEGSRYLLGSPHTPQPPGRIHLIVHTAPQKLTSLSVSLDRGLSLGLALVPFPHLSGGGRQTQPPSHTQGTRSVLSPKPALPRVFFPIPPCPPQMSLAVLVVGQRNGLSSTPERSRAWGRTWARRSQRQELFTS